MNYKKQILLSMIILLLLLWLQNNVSYKINNSKNISSANNSAVITSAKLKKLSSKLTEIVDVRNFGAKGNGVADDTLSIQAAINYVSLKGGGIVYFPRNIYIAKNIVQRANTILRFGPKTILKFPTNSVNTDRMLIVGSLDGNSLPINGSNNYYGIQGNGLIIDATNVPTGNKCNGIYVSGATNFEIDDVIGNNITKGYTIEILRSYGTRVVYPSSGVVKNIKSYGTHAWGCVAVECCTDLVIENIDCQKGTGINMESDVDVVGSGITSLKNITIQNVTTNNGTSVSLNPKKCFAINIIISNIKARLGAMLNLYYYTTGSIGSIKNVSVSNAFGDGGGVAENGFESPNDVYVDNLIVTNATAQNYHSNGFKCNAGTWYNCIAKLNGLNGWDSTFQTPTTHVAKFFSCVAQDNNVSDSVNCSGFVLLNYAKLLFYSCKATDTRTIKKQAYGVYSNSKLLFTTNCMFDGNKDENIGPPAKNARK